MLQYRITTHWTPITAAPTNLGLTYILIKNGLSGWVADSLVGWRNSRGLLILIRDWSSQNREVWWAAKKTEGLEDVFLSLRYPPEKFNDSLLDQTVKMSLFPFGSVRDVILVAPVDISAPSPLLRQESMSRIESCSQMTNLYVCLSHFSSRFGLPQIPQRFSTVFSNSIGRGSPVTRLLTYTIMTDWQRRFQEIFKRRLHSSTHSHCWAQDL